MNMNLSDPRTFGPRIRMMMPHLTPMEARVVETMLGRRDFDGTTSLKEIAEDAGVSEAMVVKIAKKLGFAGFKDFRTGLVDYRGLPSADLHSRTATGRPRCPGDVPGASMQFEQAAHLTAMSEFPLRKKRTIACDALGPRQSV